MTISFAPIVAAASNRAVQIVSAAVAGVIAGKLASKPMDRVARWTSSKWRAMRTKTPPAQPAQQPSAEATSQPTS